MNHEQSQLGQTMIEEIQQCVEPHGKKQYIKQLCKGIRYGKKHVDIEHFKFCSVYYRVTFNYLI